VQMSAALHPAGNRHFGLRPDNVCHYVEQHRGMPASKMRIRLTAPSLQRSRREILTRPTTG
jgi:hypothetical protein